MGPLVKSNALSVRVPEMSPNHRHQLRQALSPWATHRDTLVMRSSLVSDEDQGAEAPTAVRGTLLKSAEGYY
jgi:hypothetical protein